MGELYDVIVVGGGPSGLTAALYLARAKYRVLVLEKAQFGGQIAITQEVVNYPGIAKTSGSALTETMKRQAETFGAEFRLTEATGFSLSGDIKTVRTRQGELRCYGILLATGAQPATVGFRGEETYKGRGVAYCATCDGEFFTGKDIFVVGGGYAAAEESIFLTKFARHVTILIRKSDFSCAASLAERAKGHPKITVLTNTVLKAVSGDDGLNYARYQNTVTGEETEVICPPGETFGVFVLAGYCPDTGLVQGLVDLTEQGYIRTDAAQKTSVEGVYAAGDVCVKALRQVVTATADGALAATELEKYVAAMHRKTGLRPTFPGTAVSAASTESSHAPQAALFSPQERQELSALFSRLESPLVLELTLDHRPVSREAHRFAIDLADLSPMLSVTVAQEDATTEVAPCISLCRGDGTQTGLAFHGIPGGHEFTSFVLGIYNAAGPGQPLDPALLARIRAIAEPLDLKILVTLSCSMCPDLVIGAQRLAAENPHITAHVYDIQHFPELRKRYRVMSVPCLVVGDDRVSFGKKSLEQLLQLLTG